MNILLLISLIISILAFIFALSGLINLSFNDKCLWVAKLNYRIMFPESYKAYKRALVEPIRFVLTNEQKEEFCRGDYKGLYVWKTITGHCALFEDHECVIPNGPLVEDIIKKRNSCPK